MIDVTTKERLLVSTDGTAGPYIMVPLSQLDVVTRLLEAHGVSFWIEEDAISFDDAPYIAVVNLEHDARADAIQSLLDGVR